MPEPKIMKVADIREWVDQVGDGATEPHAWHRDNYITLLDRIDAQLIRIQELEKEVPGVEPHYTTPDPDPDEERYR